MTEKMRDYFNGLLVGFACCFIFYSLVNKQFAFAVYLILMIVFLIEIALGKME